MARQTLGFGLKGLGDVALKQNQRDLARDSYHQSFTLRCALGDKHCIAQTLKGLGRLLLSQGDPESGVTLLGAAESLRDQIGASIPTVHREEYATNVSTIRQSIGSEDFDRFWARGRSLSFEEVSLLISNKIAV